MSRLTAVVYLYLILSVCSLSAKPLDIEVNAEAAILINGETGAVLFEKNSHIPQYPASTTKIATALYALSQAGNDIDEPVEAEKEAIASLSPSKKKKDNYKNPAYWIEVGSTHIGIKRGEVMTLRTLMYGMMIASANDASNVVAQYVGGSIPGFVQQMNEYLKQMGSQDTHFMNPHGLHHPDHYTTAYDLAKITREAMKIPFFRELVSSVSYMKPETNKQPARTLIQTNRLLKKSSPYYYPLAIGVKNGYTSDAMYTLVGAAQKGDRYLIAVVFGSPEVKDAYKGVAAMFDAAFAEPKTYRRVLKVGPQSYSMAIKGAASRLETYLSEDVTISYYASEEPQVRASLQWDSLTLPVLKGQKVGVINLSSADGSIHQQAVLYAKEEVRPTLMFSIKRKMGEWGKNVALTRSLFAVGAVLLLSGVAFWVVVRKRRM